MSIQKMLNLRIFIKRQNTLYFVLFDKKITYIIKKGGGVV